MRERPFPSVSTGTADLRPLELSLLVPQGPPRPVSRPVSPAPDRVGDAPRRRLEEEM
jgi:hypothetical protein